MKFVVPWLLFRILWIPTTRKIFTSLTVDYHYTVCQASSRLSYINVGLGCSILLASLLYNEQLPVCFIARW